MQAFLIKKNIHEDDFFTFETSWIGLEKIDFESRTVDIPLLNLDVQNLEVLNFFNITSHSGIYIEHCFFSFRNVSKIKKEFAIHSNEKMEFMTRINNVMEFTNDKLLGDKVFELGGMGVFQDYTYDGNFKITASECYFIISDDESYTTSFKSMNSYDPINNNWLKNFSIGKVE